MIKQSLIILSRYHHLFLRLWCDIFNKSFLVLVCIRTHYWMFLIMVGSRGLLSTLTITNISFFFLNIQNIHKDGKQVLRPIVCGVSNNHTTNHGQWFLNWRNKTTTGRYLPKVHARVSELGVPMNSGGLPVMSLSSPLCYM